MARASATFLSLLSLSTILTSTYITAQSTSPAWSRMNPPFPLTGRSHAVTTTNTTAFISVGGRRDDSSLSGLSLGYDVLTNGFVETPTSLTFDRAAVTSAPDGTTYVFGGMDSANKEHNILWQLTTSNRPNVTVLSPAGPAAGNRPGPRKLAGMAYLTNCTSATFVGSQPCLVVIGGDTAGVKNNEVWMFTLNTLTWIRITSAGAPPARSGHAVVASADNSKLYVFGGDTATGTSNDIYVLSPSGFTDSVPSEMLNTAAGKFAYQSSNDPTWGTRGARAGTDNILTTNFNGVANGNPATCSCNYCSHSNAEANPYWVVDLGAADTVVDFIYLYARSDCCVERNQNFKIYYGNSNSSQYNSPGVQLLTGGQVPTDLRFGGPNIIPTPGLKARYIFYVLPGPVRVVSMCEFQAYQRRTWIWRTLSGTYNAALLKSATQSSTLSGWGDGLAFRAVDGAVTNNLNVQPYTCSHTANDIPIGGFQFWLVDLGSTHDVSSVTVFGRTDCCTNRNQNILWYIGNSRDWNYNTYCTNSPASITPASGRTSVTFSCNARGRYLIAVKAVRANLDDNMITLCEVQATANRLLDQPATRASMSYTTYGGSLVIFGGADSSGFRYNDVRMFDMERNRWLPPVAPLGTPPVARAFASFILLPNATIIGQSLPSNRIALFGGYSNVDQLNDFMVLTFPQCPPYDRNGIITEDCRHGGTVCYFTCAGFTTNSNPNTPLVCQPDGTWRGVLPPCRPLVSNPPTGVVATLTGNNAVTVSWNPAVPSSAFYPITRYRASALINDVVETFPLNAFQDPSKWTLMPTYTGPCPNPPSSTCTFVSTQTANSYDFSGGNLRLFADLGRNTWFDSRESVTLIREWPTSIVDPAGSWAIETFMQLDREEFITQGGQMACLGLVDMGKYNGTGVLEMYAGVRLDGDGVFRIGLESSINRFNNWYSTLGRTFGFIRIERDATLNPPVYRSYYKYRNADNWIKMPVTVSESWLRDGGITNPANLRPALAGRNWNGGSRFVSMYSYLRVGPLTCGDPGTIRFVDRLIQSSIIYGLAPTSSYRFAVWAETIPAGFSAASVPSSIITMPAISPPAIGGTILVSQGRPCSSSTVYQNNPAFACNQAVDGSLTSQLFHSESQNPDGEWITIDLQVSTAVKLISIYNRQDCCMERSRDFSMYVGDNPGGNFIANARCDPAFVPTSLENWNWMGTPLGWTNLHSQFQCQLTGRYVTMQIKPNLGYFPFDGWLNLREIQVFAGNSCPNRGATGATQVVGTRCTSAGWGAICTFQCLPGFVQVGGATSSACNGEAWDAPELICAPACPDLPSPQYSSTCSQTYYSENFDNVNGTALSKLISLEVMTQPIGLPVTNPPVRSKWFNVDGVLQATARYGCNSDLHLVIASQKIRNYPSSFSLSARISTNDRAGLLWRAQDKLNMYRFWLDATMGLGVVEKVVAGNPRRITDFPITLVADTFYSVGVSMFNAQMNISVNGIQMVDTADRQFLVGYAGVYAQTVGLFDDLLFEASCVGLAIGATNQDIARFTCNPGMISLGPSFFTCVQTGSTPAWSPDPATQPMTCTLPPPTFIPSVLMIRENSIKNANVGDALVAFSSSPDWQLQWQLTGGTDLGIFWIDACSGQVKLRTGGDGVLDYELRNTYILSVRAFIPGFANAETYRNITVSILNLDEPPIMIPSTVYVTENAAVLSSGTYVWNSNTDMFVTTTQAWDPENSTVNYALTVDGADGAFTLNTTSGVFRVAPSATNPNISAALSFEASATALNLQVTVSQVNDTTMFSTGIVTVILVDANDPPYITRSQVLNIVDTAMYQDVVGTVEALDEDTGVYANALTYTQIYGAEAVSKCDVQNGFHPAVDESVPVTSNTALFSVDSATGQVTIIRNTTTAKPAARWKNWDEDLVFVSNNILARAVYTLCVNVTDGQGGSDVQPVRIIIKANVPTKPQIFNATGATQMSTAGNEIVTFNGVGFLPAGYSVAVQPPLSVWYTNGVYTYNSSCEVTSDVTMDCTTQPGIGANHIWYFVLKYKPILMPTAMQTSYKVPTVTSIINNHNMSTLAGTVITLLGNDFGPVRTPVTINYGRNFEYACAQAGNTSHTVVYCKTADGTGANLPFTISVGGQTTTYSSSLLWSYLPPVIYNVTPASGASFTVDTLDTMGGETVVIVGGNFGPSTTLSSLNYIDLRYGGPRGVALPFDSCQQAGGDLAHSMITCKTVPGVGRNHFASIQVDGQTSPVYPSGNVTVGTLSYLPPVITRISGPGARNADTAGGQAIYIEGKNFGPASFAVAYSSVHVSNTIESVEYGRVNTGLSFVNQYNARNCRVSVPGTEIMCATDEGIGRDHVWKLTLGGQTTPLYYALTSYAAPQVISFSDAGAVDADTIGHEKIQIYGRNFGPATAFTNSRLTVFYGVVLAEGAFTNISYTAANCSIKVSHVQAECETLPGAGKGLVWEILLDEQLSTNPTTNYHEPVVQTISMDLADTVPVTAANVNGGETVYVHGEFFGPADFQYRGRSLIQRVSYGLTGIEYVVPENMWNAIDHYTLSVKLLPGVGTNLRFRVTVADQTSAASTGTFSFAIPVIERVVPNTAGTFSNPKQPTIITLLTRNFPLLDSRSRYVLTFGQGSYQLTLPVTFPSGIMAINAAKNSDDSINASFPLPKDHLGEGLGIKIAVLQGDSSVPVITTTVTANSVFSYLPAVVSDVVVTRALFYDSTVTSKPPGDYIDCPFPSNSPSWSCWDSSVMQIVLVGENFGEAPGNMDHIDGVTRELKLLCRNFTDEGYAMLGENWGTDCTDKNNVNVRLWLYSWTHKEIVVFSSIPLGTIRLSLTSPLTWNGLTPVQTITRPFKNDNPAIGNMVGAITGIPCAGSIDPFLLQIENLGGSTDLKIDIGGRPALIYLNDCRPGSPTENTIIHAPTSSLIAALLACATPPIWNVTVYAPPGQGTNVPVTVIRFTGLSAFSSAGREMVSYAPPVITSVSYKVYPTSSFVTEVVPSGSLQNLPTVTVPTDGTAIVQLIGTNLGIAPIIRVADGNILPSNNIRPCWSVGNNFTCWEFTTPEGEGDGLYPSTYGSAFKISYPFGYTVFLSAADQDSNRVPFRYLSPVVTSIVSSNTEFPTRGNVTVSIHGSNFGKYSGRSVYTEMYVTFGQPDIKNSPSLICTDVIRVSHTLITCTLPEGSGKNLNVTVAIAGLYGGSVGTIFSYDRPVIMEAYTVTDFDPSTDLTGWTKPGYVTSTVVPGVNANTRTLTGPTDGEQYVFVHGKNFGKGSTLQHCIFMTWFNRDNSTTKSHVCNDNEDFLGEGEVAMARVVLWSHELIVFKSNPGIGHKELEISVRGTSLGFVQKDTTNIVRFIYQAPNITSLELAQGYVGDTEGNDIVILTGKNFGPVMRETRVDYLNDIVFNVPVPLSDAPALPTGYIVVVFHSQCIARAYDVIGRKETVSTVMTSTGSKSLEDCAYTIRSQTQTEIQFRTPPGVGANKNVSIHIVDRPFTQVSNTASFSYHAPDLMTGYFNPSYLYVNSGKVTGVDVAGKYFGNFDLADSQSWSAFEREIFASASGRECEYVKRRREDGETIISCGINPTRFVAGAHNFSVTVAGQTGFKPSYPFTKALKIVCNYGSYGRANETCVACPMNNPDNPTKNGAICRGFVREIEETLGFEAALTYPVPLPGWYNLNSSDAYTKRWAPGTSMMDACPRDPINFQDNGRDVCIVPCDPPDSCLGDNICAYGYTSKPPMWRCASCDTSFYKRAGECIKCPDSPAALFIGFILLIIFAGSIGFMLNKRQVNIAVISIGVDYFQVLAIFSQSRIKWPPIVKELLHVLSAFNLNIEIVAPECLIPDVSYKQKFWFIMLLPLSVGGLMLGGIFTSIFIYKALIKGMPKKKWFTHTPTLVSSTLILLYMLYLYLTRTIFDVFNCTPTMPPDGYTYLQVVFERCGVPGGTQVTLLPYAIAGLIVYTGGYPFFIGYTIWKNRELVMEDQLLRAKGVGNDKLSNPHAYHFRKQYGRSYFQFKPDNCLWILAIILRKFFIALTAVVFNKNASFQMAACLLVMFIAYSAQMMVYPYMSPAEYDEVLKSHIESSYTSAIHARLRTAIANIETRGRKKARKNLINFDGKVDRNAILGILSGWLFNYNTVEQIMLFAAVIVCLMGIMYQANEVSSYYPESKDSVTAVVLAVIIISIIYFFTVFVTEIIVLYNEANRAQQLARVAKLNKSKSRSGSHTEEEKTVGTRGRLVDESGDINTGKLDTQMNPLFMSSNGNVSNEGMGIDSLLQSRSPPPPELWLLFQQGYVDMKNQIEGLTGQLLEAKKSAQLGSNPSASNDTEPAVSSPINRKKAFAPKSTGDADNKNALNAFKSGSNQLKSLRMNRKDASKNNDDV